MPSIDGLRMTLCQGLPVLLQFTENVYSLSTYIMNLKRLIVLAIKHVINGNFLTHQTPLYFSMEFYLT